MLDISGGLDSSSLACIAGELRRQGAILPNVYGIHASAPHSQENDDRHLAAFVAEVSALPVSSLSYDELEPFRGISHPRVWTDTPAPPLLFYTEFYERLFQVAAYVPIHAHIRGDFGDQLFDGLPAYLHQLAAEHRYLRLLREAWAWQQSGIISASSVLFSSLAARRRPSHRLPPLQERLPWVRQEVLKEAIQRKQAEVNFLAHLVPDPLARQLYQALLQHDDYLAQQNESTRAGLETREPYLDGRLLTFLLSSAPQNYLRFGTRKFLLREAMQSLLPEAIRTRRSKGRIARLLFEGMARSHRPLRELMITMPEELEPFVDAARLAQAVDVAAYGGALDQTPDLRALALVLWAHRLPWCNGRLPRLEGLERFEQTKR